MTSVSPQSHKRKPIFSDDPRPKKETDLITKYNDYQQSPQSPLQYQSSKEIPQQIQIVRQPPPVCSQAQYAHQEALVGEAQLLFNYNQQKIQYQEEKLEILKNQFNRQSNAINYKEIQSQLLQNQERDFENQIQLYKNRIQQLNLQVEEQKQEKDKLNLAFKTREQKILNLQQQNQQADQELEYYRNLANNTQHFNLEYEELKKKIELQELRNQTLYTTKKIY